VTSAHSRAPPGGLNRDRSGGGNPAAAGRVQILRTGVLLSLWERPRDMPWTSVCDLHETTPLCPAFLLQDTSGRQQCPGLDRDMFLPKWDRQLW
jgi:hypothetical protein